MYSVTVAHCYGGMWDQSLSSVIDCDLNESTIKIDKFFYSLNKLQMHFAIFDLPKNM